MTTLTDFPHHILQLSDGRQISYSRAGDPAGQTVLHFHGTPGSRIEAYFLEDAAKRYGFDVYALDRPGFGYSTPSPGRTLNDWVTDVTEFADALKLNKFGIIALSGGGPYLHACVHKIPNRILPNCVYDLAGVLSTGESPVISSWMTPAERYIASRSRRGGGPMSKCILNVVRFVFKRIPESLFERMLSSSLEKKDKHKVKGMGKIFNVHMQEAFRQGLDAIADDLRVVYSDPHFHLNEIQLPGVQFWHGNRDKIVPYELTVYKGEQVKGSSIRTFPNKNHLFMLVVLKDVFGDVSSRSTTATSS